MTAKQIAEMLKASAEGAISAAEREIRRAFCSDMMSDVLAYGEGRDILVTGLANPQVIRTAAMLDMNCVVLTGGKCATQEMRTLAANNGIIMMETALSSFEVCGILYRVGLLA